jgi:hypothetical protein
VSDPNENKWFLSDLHQDERTTLREPLSDYTRIVRYVPVTTLLLYRANKVFIPSLRLLQSSDPFESKLPEFLFEGGYGQGFASHFKTQEAFLISIAQSLGATIKPSRLHTREEWNVLARIWLRELARRRAVWCWNVFKEESNAMWQIYGAKGVAIFSTIGQVKSALAKAGPFRCLIAHVRYPIARRMILAGENAQPTLRMIQEANLFRPYLFKHPGYRYEDEVRFVFGIHPDLIQEEAFLRTAPTKGILIDLEFETLKARIDAAKDIVPDEAAILGELLNNAAEKKIEYPGLPGEQNQKWVDRYKPIGGTPFTMQDDPQSLFTDLS